jgi:general stress protein YciG
MTMTQRNTGQAGERDGHSRFVTGSATARDAGRIGGIASTGSFQKGSERAREAGRKGGRRGRKETTFAEFVLNGIAAQHTVDEILAAYEARKVPVTL